MKLACLFVRKLLHKGETGKDLEVHAVMGELLLDLCAEKCREL